MALMILDTDRCDDNLLNLFINKPQLRSPPGYSMYLFRARWHNPFNVTICSLFSYLKMTFLLSYVRLYTSNQHCNLFHAKISQRDNSTFKKIPKIDSHLFVSVCAELISFHLNCAGSGKSLDCNQY